MQKNNEKKRNIILTIILVLTIIIILLLLKCCSGERQIGEAPFGPSNTASPNLDIILLDKYYEYPNGNAGTTYGEADKKTNDGKATENSVPNKPISIKEKGTGTLFGDDVVINVFKNIIYDMRAVIAPLSSGEYSFIIENPNKQTLNTKLTFEEVNKYNIDMRYRLKSNAGYFSNEWKTPTDMLNVCDVGGGKTKEFTLEWKWFEGSNDTTAGIALDRDYQLKIKIFAEGK